MDCIFCKIAHRELPANTVFEDEKVLAFEDLKPQAPKHILVIPKKHIATIDDAQDDDKDLLGHMILTAKQIAANQSLSKDGYRLVYNVNSGGGQEVYHLHLHLLGGRQMTWPPG